MKHINKYKLLFIAIFFISSCTSLKQDPAPVENGTDYKSPPNSTSPDEYNNPYTSYNTNEQSNTYSNQGNITHTVIAGDTVYNIAKRYGITQDDLIQLNNIVNNQINIGQILIIKKSSVQVPSTKPDDNNINSNETTSPNKRIDKNRKIKNYDGISWMNPTNGNIIKTFGNGSKGIDITGDLNQPVYAVADGKVVYSGSTLKGYGNLIIVQHTPVYLTAYANNNKLLFKKGDVIKQGQVIANMGNSDSNIVKLHFEIRKDGSPVDPTKYLPF